MRDRDGILTYFNSDNTDKVKDCLRLPSGIYVPFSADRFEFTTTVGESCHERTANGVTTSQRRRSALHLHAALCHAGQTRVSQSNVTIDGEKVTSRIPHDAMCAGCAFGGTRRIHRLQSSVRQPGKVTESEKATFFGQVV